MGENSLKTGTLCLTGLAEADQEWARLEKDSTSIFFFFADSSRLTRVMINH